ncbi:MAG: DUF1320 domain-containing protein [Pseudomonadota bacterium]
MAYITIDDLIARFGSAELIDVADRDDDGAADPDVVAAAISDAEDVINGYLAAVATVPLTTVPEVVKRLASQIARWFLHKDDPSEAIRQGYKDAIALLDEIRAGDFRLDLGEPGEAPTAGSRVKGSAAPQVFNASRLSGFVP